MKYSEEIKEKAKSVKTENELIEFLKELKEKEHDYDSIVHACYAAMKAAFNVVNNSPQGGITGFQAGFIGWMAIRDFMMFNNDAPLRILDYSHMLFPQYQDKFEKVITKETWGFLQSEAKKNLEKENAHPNVMAHWKTIAGGKVPFGYQVKDYP